MVFVTPCSRGRQAISDLTCPTPSQAHRRASLNRVPSFPNDGAQSSGDGQILSNRRTLSPGGRAIFPAVGAVCSAVGTLCSDVRAFSVGTGAICAALGANCPALGARKAAGQEKSSATGAFFFAPAVD